MKTDAVKVVGERKAPLSPAESLRHAASLRRIWKKACAAQGITRPRGVIIRGRTWEEAEHKYEEITRRG